MIGNAIRTLYLFALLFAVVFALVYCGAFLLEWWRLEWQDWEFASERAYDDVRLVLPHTVIAVVGWIALALTCAPMLIGTAVGSRRVQPGRYPFIEQMLKRLCDRAHMPVPHLAILETPEQNAFASGLTQDQFTVTLTTGLIGRLTAEEIEGVMAHELAHIRHRDVRLGIIGAAVAGGIALVFEALYYLIWRGLGFIVRDAADADGYGEISGWIAMLACLPLLVVAWFITQLINLAISRTRVFRADAGAVELTGNPDALASALKKITEDCDIRAPSGVKAMCIAAPEALFSTHPTVEERVKALSALRPASEQPGPAKPRLVKPKAGTAPDWLMVSSGFGRRTR